MKTNLLLVLSSLLLVSACGKKQKAEYKKAEATMPMESVTFQDEKEIGLGEMVMMEEEEIIMPAEEQESDIEILGFEEEEEVMQPSAAMPSEVEEEEIDITLDADDEDEASGVDIK